jgi:hypothetical protein
MQMPVAVSLSKRVSPSQQGTLDAANIAVNTFVGALADFSYGIAHLHPVLSRDDFFR